MAVISFAIHVNKQSNFLLSTKKKLYTIKKYLLLYMGIKSIQKAPLLAGLFYCLVIFDSDLISSPL